MRSYAVLRQQDDGKYGLLNIVPVHGVDEAKLAQAYTTAQRLAQGWRQMFQTAQIVVALQENLNGCNPINNHDGKFNTTSYRSSSYTHEEIPEVYAS